MRTAELATPTCASPRGPRSRFRPLRVVLAGVVGLALVAGIVPSASARGGGIRQPGGAAPGAPAAPGGSAGGLPNSSGGIDVGSGVDPGRPSPEPNPLPGAPADADRERRIGSAVESARGPATPAPTTPAPAVPERRVVEHVRHGSVRFVADLARVDLDLSIRNVGTTPIEWRRTYRIDPSAEVVSATLHRSTTREAISARTLTQADARRIYEEARSPRRPRTPTPPQGRDPLRLERPRRARLEVVVWPVAPEETIRVALVFVTPLRGSGAERTYVDVLEDDHGAGDWIEDDRWQDETLPQRDPLPGGVLASAGWDVNPGHYMLTSVGPGLASEIQPDGTWTVRMPPGEIARLPEIRFRAPTRETPFVTAVPGGGVDRYIGAWRFDPRAWLEERGFDIRPDLTLRIVPTGGDVDRLAPATFGATDQARPITARLLSRDATMLRHAVEVVDRSGQVVHRDEVALPIRREQLDQPLAAVVTGWYRAMLVGRVLDAAQREGSGRALAEAQAFAVDQGVLAAGTAALALPAAERRNLTAESRGTFDRDGVPLGAPRREADLRPFPQWIFEQLAKQEQVAR